MKIEIIATRMSAPIEMMFVMPIVTYAVYKRRAQRACSKKCRHAENIKMRSQVLAGLSHSHGGNQQFLNEKGLAKIRVEGTLSFLEISSSAGQTEQAGQAPEAQPTEAQHYKEGQLQPVAYPWDALALDDVNLASLDADYCSERCHIGTERIDSFKYGIRAREGMLYKDFMRVGGHVACTHCEGVTANELNPNRRSLQMAAAGQDAGEGDEPMDATSNYGFPASVYCDALQVTSAQVEARAAVAGGWRGQGL